MKDNYTHREEEEIVRLARFYNVDPSKVRQLLDDYFTEKFEDAMNAAQESLQYDKEARIAEAQNNEHDYEEGE